MDSLEQKKLYKDINDRVLKALQEVNLHGLKIKRLNENLDSFAEDFKKLIIRHSSPSSISNSGDI
jgi:hypothetical protein